MPRASSREGEERLMGDWIAFSESQQSISVDARRRYVHYRTMAQDIRAHVPAGTSVLDFGCGEALHAGIVAAPARRLILCEAAPKVRTALVERHRGHPVEVRSPEEVLRCRQDRSMSS